MTQDTTSPRARFRTWLTMVLERTGWNEARLARAAGVSPSTINRALAGDVAPSLSTIAKIVAVTGIAMPSDLGMTPPSSGFSEPEATPYGDAGDQPSGASPGFDRWQIAGRGLELAGVLPGDVVLVDTRAVPRPRDIVCAQVYDLARGTAETVFREIDPPYLLTRTADPASHRKPLLVDGERVLIMGVVVQLVRRRMA